MFINILVLQIIAGGMRSQRIAQVELKPHKSKKKKKFYVQEAQKSSENIKFKI